MGASTVSPDRVTYGEILLARIRFQELTGDATNDEKHQAIWHELQEILQIAQNSGAISAVISKPEILDEHQKLLETNMKLHKQVYG